MQLRRRDRLLGRSNKTKLANAKPLVPRPHRRTKRPARHRTVRIQIASPRHWIQNRAHLVIRKVLEPFQRIVILEKQACISVTRKSRRKPRDTLTHTIANQPSLLIAKQTQPLAKAFRIQRPNPEHTRAALIAPRPAGQPMPTTHRRIRQRGVHNLHEFAITLRKHRD